MTSGYRQRAEPLGLIDNSGVGCDGEELKTPTFLVSVVGKLEVPLTSLRKMAGRADFVGESQELRLGPGRLKMPHACSPSGNRVVVGYMSLGFLNGHCLLFNYSTFVHAPRRLLPTPFITW